MIVINKTISFAESVQNEGVEWIKSSYIPLLLSCPIVSQARLLKIDTQEGVDECFALQVIFETPSHFAAFCEKYESDFDNALLIKFKNYMGVFKTILREF